MGKNWNNKGSQSFNGRQTLGVWVPPDQKNILFRYYTVAGEDVGRLDLISFKVYGREDYFWVIAQFNNVLDIFNGITVGQVLRIPDITSYMSAWSKSNQRFPSTR